MIGLKGIKLKVTVHGECEEPKDEHKWYIAAGNLVLATITFRKYVNFSMYEVDYIEIGVSDEPTPIPSQLKSKNTLEDALTAIQAHLKIEELSS